jgi:hypothetical protein
MDKINAKVVMGVGGTFDFLTGNVPMPPEIVSKLGIFIVQTQSHDLILSFYPRNPL